MANSNKPQSKYRLTSPNKTKQINRTKRRGKLPVSKSKKIKTTPDIKNKSQLLKPTVAPNVLQMQPHADYNNSGPVDRMVEAMEQELHSLKKNNAFGLKTDFFKNTTKLIDALIKVKYGFNLSAAMTESFRGPNILAQPTHYKPNTNNAGYVFTTRPDLNLASENIKLERALMPLLTDRDNFSMRAIRLILCPRLAMRIADVEFGGSVTGESDLRRNPNSKLIDPFYPFIAISDNNVRSLTGWPSSSLGVQSSQAGLAKEVHVMADGPTTYKGEYSLNLSISSMKGSPTLYLYHFWIEYIAAVLKNTNGLIPWPEYFGESRLDYTTRIYRLVMDETRTFVEEMAATGYAFPRGIDIGPIFDYNREQQRPYMDRAIEVEFVCSGAIYLDDLLIKQFNETILMFNPNMAPNKRGNYYVKVEKKYHRIFNNKCYPWINQTTRELEWWVRKEVVFAHRDLLVFSKHVNHQF